MLIRATASYADCRALPRSSPTAVTASTRPPAVTSVPSSRRAVPACRRLTPATCAADSRPVISSPVRGEAGYPSPATTTVTAAPPDHDSGGGSAGPPGAAAGESPGGGGGGHRGKTPGSAAPQRP